MTRAPRPDVVAALQDLAGGRLSGWHGLPEHCSLDDTDTAFGPGEPVDHGGTLAGAPAVFRRYPATPTAPGGLNVWHDDGRVAVIEIWNLRMPAAEASGVAGAAEAELRSALGVRHRQFVLGSRGLALHVRHAADPPSTIDLVLAFASCRTEDFVTGPLAGVGTEVYPASG